MPFLMIFKETRAMPGTKGKLAYLLTPVVQNVLR